MKTFATIQLSIVLFFLIYFLFFCCPRQLNIYWLFLSGCSMWLCVIDGRNVWCFMSSEYRHTQFKFNASFKIVLLHVLIAFLCCNLHLLNYKRERYFLSLPLMIIITLRRQLGKLRNCKMKKAFWINVVHRITSNKTTVAINIFSRDGISSIVTLLVLTSFIETEQLVFDIGF